MVVIWQGNRRETSASCLLGFAVGCRGVDVQDLQLQPKTLHPTPQGPEDLSLLPPWATRKKGCVRTLIHSGELTVVGHLLQLGPTVTRPLALQTLTSLPRQSTKYKTSALKDFCASIMGKCEQEDSRAVSSELCTSPLPSDAGATDLCRDLVQYLRGQVQGFV